MHNMQTFYSGTDWDTLLENANNYDFFLSVIVNNEGATIAKISLQGFIEEPETINTYKYKFNRGFLEKEVTKEKKITEVIYVYTCKINIENNVDEEFNKLLEIQEKKRIANFNSTAAYSINKFNNRTFTNSDFKDGWLYGNNKKQNPRNPDFKVKLHKQVELLPDKNNSILDRNLILPTTKELTLSFLTALMLQDDDLDFTFELTYNQAVEMWDKEVGIEMLKEFSEYVDVIIDDVFNNIFGDEIEVKELEEIKIHTHIILGKSIQEEAIRPIIDKYLNSIV